MIKAINEEKDLGVVFDSKSRFPSNTTDQAEKVNKLMGLFRRSYSILNMFSFRYLFVSLVLPRIFYRCLYSVYVNIYAICVCLYSYMRLHVCAFVYVCIICTCTTSLLYLIRIKCSEF